MYTDNCREKRIRNYVFATERRHMYYKVLRDLSDI